jgi:hypothetical protein
MTPLVELSGVALLGERREWNRFKVQKCLEFDEQIPGPGNSRRGTGAPETSWQGLPASLRVMQRECYAQPSHELSC